MLYPTYFLARGYFPIKNEMITVNIVEVIKGSPFGAKPFSEAMLPYYFWNLKEKSPIKF